MISYQWDVQKSMIQLKNQLQAQGYKVWMDIDEMGGSTLESMARAVENASVVLVCVSQKYKESPNCRSGNIAYLITTQPPTIICEIFSVRVFYYRMPTFVINFSYR